MTQANNVAIESSQINSSGVLQPAGGGTGVTTTTGSGSAVLNTSPTLVTPNIGAASGTSLSLSSTISASSFSGAGTGLTGTASSLSIGGNSGGVTGLSRLMSFVGEFPTANSQDFNNLFGSGYYDIVWGNFSGTLNTPPASNSYGTLLVEGGSNFYTQIFTPYSSNNPSPCIRTYYNGSWGSWVVGLTSANINSQSVVAKAWVNFSCPSSTVTVNGSFNISSVTRSGGGQYTASFTNAMSSTNYAISGGICSAYGDGNSMLIFGYNGNVPSTSSFPINTRQTGGTFADMGNYIYAVVFSN